MTDTDEASPLAVRLAQLESQLVGQAERIADLEAALRRQKQSGVILRVLILVTALAAFFFLRAGL